MADFPILFTGKEVSYEPRTTGELERSSARFHEKILQAEKVKADKRKSDESFFYKVSDIDPVQLSAEKGARDQAQLMDDFNNTWGKVMKDQGGTFTQEQRMQMFQGRKTIEAKQSQWLASQNKMERDWKLYGIDQRRADPMFEDASMQKAMEDFDETGIWPDDAIQYSSINPTQHFTKSKFPGSGKTKQVVKQVGDELITDQVKVPITREEAQEYIATQIEADMKKHGRLLKGVIEDFVSRPDAEKAEYLKAIDGEVDTPEERNAIIRWAQDAYLPNVYKEQTSTRVRPVTSSSSAASKVYRYEGSTLFDKSNNEVLVFSKDSDGNVYGKGKGLKSIALDVSPDQLKAEGGKSLESDLGGEIQNDIISVRPTKIGKTVALVTKNTITIKKSSTDVTDTPDDYEEVDGTYYWEEKIPSGMIVGADISDVRGELGTYLGGDAFQQAVDENFNITAPQDQAVSTVGFLKNVADVFTGGRFSGKKAATNKAKEPKAEIKESEASPKSVIKEEKTTTKQEGQVSQAVERDGWVLPENWAVNLTFSQHQKVYRKTKKKYGEGGKGSVNAEDFTSMAIELLNDGKINIKGAKKQEDFSGFKRPK